jgi:hypothetical protein
MVKTAVKFLKGTLKEKEKNFVAYTDAKGDTRVLSEAEYRGMQGGNRAGGRVTEQTQAIQTAEQQVRAREADPMGYLKAQQMAKQPIPEEIPQEQPVAQPAPVTPTAAPAEPKGIFEKIKANVKENVAKTGLDKGPIQQVGESAQKVSSSPGAMAVLAGLPVAQFGGAFAGGTAGATAGGTVATGGAKVGLGGILGLGFVSNILYKAYSNSQALTLADLKDSDSAMGLSLTGAAESVKGVGTGEVSYSQALYDVEMAENNVAQLEAALKRASAVNLRIMYTGGDKYQERLIMAKKHLQDLKNIELPNAMQQGRLQQQLNAQKFGIQ